MTNSLFEDLALHVSPPPAKAGKKKTVRKSQAPAAALYGPLSDALPCPGIPGSAVARVESVDLPAFGVELAGADQATRKAANDHAVALSAGVDVTDRAALKDLLKALPADDVRALRAYSGGGHLGESTDAYYTPTRLAFFTWYLLTKLDARIRTALEPSCGTGPFLATAPSGVRLTAVEYDPDAARIAQLLHPHAHVHPGSFEAYHATSADPRPDVVIGNPPFGARGETVRLDPRHADLRRAERYFLKAGLERLAPGGYLAYILPHHLMGESHQAFRRELLDHATVIGAYLIPDGAFKATGASVTTMLLVLRAHDHGVSQVLPRLPADLRETLYSTRDRSFMAGTLCIDGDRVQRPSLSSAHTVTTGQYGLLHVKGDLDLSESRVDSIVRDAQSARESALTAAATEALLLSQPLGELKAELLAALQGAERHPIPDGTLSECRSYVFRRGQWRYASLLATPEAQTVMELARELQREQLTARPSATKAQLETRLRDLAAGDPDAQAARIRTIARTYPAANLVLHPPAVPEHRPLLILPGSIEDVAVQLARGWDLSLRTLSTQAGVTEAEAGDFLLAHYRFDGHRWVPPIEYDFGHAYEKAGQARRDAELHPHGSFERRALTRQADQLEDRALAQAKSITDTAVTPRDPLVPTEALQAWVNTYLGTHDGDAPRILITRERGLTRLIARHGHASDRYHIDGHVTARLERYLNFDTEVDRIERADMTPEQIEAQKTAALKKAVRYERSIELHFRTWLQSSEYATDIEDAYNRTRNAYLTGPEDTSLLHLPEWKGPPHHLYQRGDIRTLAAWGHGLLAYEVGLGKALDDTMPVYTPTGPVPIGDLKVGDKVIGSDGRPTTVTGVYPQGMRPAYQVTFSDGCDVVCDLEHLWAVKDDNRRFRGQPHRVLTLRQILEEGLTKNTTTAGKHFIPITEPIHFTHPGKRPLHPYLLGLLLGDGCFRATTPTFATPDRTLVTAVRTLLPKGVKISHIANYDYRLTTGPGSLKNPLTGRLRTLGLWGHHSHSKFIPDAYLYGPVKDRIALLQGLMDTDGSVTRNGNVVEFSSTSEALARGVRFLVQSLGGTATYRVKQTTHRPSHRLTVCLPNTIAPFRLNRKKSVYKGRTKYQPSRAIRNVEPVGERPMTCISVDAPDRLFLTRDAIITHNTYSQLGLLSILKQRGEAQRPWIVTPLSLTGNWVMNAHVARPDWRVVVIGMNPTGTFDEDGLPEFTPDSTPQRKEKLARLLHDPYDLVIISMEAFTDIPLLEETRIHLIEHDAAQLAQGAQHEGFDVKQSTFRGRKALVKEEDFLSALISRGKTATATDLPFELFAPDCLTFEEAHKFKNLFEAPDYLGDKPKFMGAGLASIRAYDAYLKARWVRQQQGGRGTYALTATPWKNSPLEVAFCMALITDDLAAFGLNTPASFMLQYCQIEPTVITSADGGVGTRPAVVGFKNLRELRGLMNAHVITRDALSCQMDTRVGLPIPPLQRHIHTLELTRQQEAAYLPERQAAQNPDKEGSNHLFAIYNRMQGYIIHPEATCGGRNPRAEKMAEIALDAETTGHKSVIFLDRGGDGGPDSAYAAYRNALIQVGIPADAIEIVTATTHPNAVVRLAAEKRFRQGKTRHVIGSSVIREGFNLQYLTKHLIHLDLPHDPQDIKQRDGRGWRQGNPSTEIHSHFLLARGSFDALAYTNIQGKKGWLDHLASDSDSGENPVAFQAAQTALLLAADPDKVAEYLREREEALRREAERLAERERFGLAERFLATAGLLRDRHAKAQGRKHGPSKQDVQGISRLTGELTVLARELARQPEAVRQVLFLDRVLTWVDGLPLTRDLRFTLETREYTVKHVDTGGHVTTTSGARLTFDDLEAASGLLLPEGDGLYTANPLRDLPLDTAATLERLLNEPQAEEPDAEEVGAPEEPTAPDDAVAPRVRLQDGLAAHEALLHTPTLLDPEPRHYAGDRVVRVGTTPTTGHLYQPVSGGLRRIPTDTRPGEGVLLVGISDDTVELIAAPATATQLGEMLNLNPGQILDRVAQLLNLYGAAAD